jgi:hypothetical protein
VAVHSAVRAPRSELENLRLQSAARILASSLKVNALGRANARPKRICMEALAKFGHAVSSRDYDRLAAIAVALGLYVGTSGDGAFWIETEEDQAAAEGNLASRFEPMRTHHQNLLRQRRHRFGEPRLF